MVSKSAVVGIDLGTSDSYVAFVGKGIVDVVQNEVSKRATPTLVGFTDRERLLGDAALAQIKSNAKNTCRNFKHLLGRNLEASDLEKEAFWSTSKLTTTEDGLAGYEVSYKGEAREFSAVQVTGMYLTKLKEVTEKWCQAKVADVVISVPSFFSDMQRQAVLDASRIAGLSVLRVMNEQTATALAYGIYRSNDFDPEKPVTVAFCSMGHAIFSVAIVQFVRGRLTVLCEKSQLVGGRDMDECLMREFAAQFQKKVGADPLSSKKAAFKLEDAVTKTKKILSANSEANLSVECLMEEEDFASQISRSDFEKMCGPAMAKTKALLDTVIASSPVPVDKIDSVEIVGGASRVPWVKRLCSEAFGGKELSTTMNQEESVARGCALQAAMLSPLYKVRDFKVEEASPIPINISWTGGHAESEFRTAPVFPAGSSMNILKLLTFYRTGPFDVKAEFADTSLLPPLTPKELGTFRVDLPAQQEPRKVKVRAKITLHGTFQLEGAQLLEEEEYEETVRERREVPAEGGAANAEGVQSPEAAEGEKQDAEASKEPEKKPEWVDVVKKQTRVKRTDLKVTASGCPGLSEDALQKRAAEELAMIEEMREIIEVDERRNDLESYIFTTRNKISEGNEYGAYISDPDREAFNSALTAAEDWLYDSTDRPKAQIVEKLAELKSMGDPVAWRCKEEGMRAEWVAAVVGTVKNYRLAAESPGEKYKHVSPDGLGKVLAACAETENWLNELKAKQDALPKHEKPVLVCAEMEKKNRELAKIADAILKEAKGASPKTERREETPKAAKAEAPSAEEPKSPQAPQDAPAGAATD